MRQFNFKMFEETDPGIIKKLDSLSCRQRSEEIRKALRAYFRRQTGTVRVISSASDAPLLNEVSDSILEIQGNPEPEQSPEEIAKMNLEKLKNLF